jgi:lipopolysaccharide transport system ATP-binding protein
MQAMTDTMIRVENLGKMYRIGVVQHGHTTLTGRMISSITGPVRRLLIPDLARAGADELETIWALRKISFELKRGEVLGIIGRNGSGKSTLLKIISRVTAPTEGRVLLNGRVGSLLEVGIGFHPDLTGRENIYLSGAVQGLKRQRIDNLLDEIIEFSEIGNFIDTPVKRYSSGMYVRLAFSVAAHFDQDILILDEVLAVGDSSFQRKCLEKMERIAKSGKTVLFVSHGMASVTRLCDKGLYLKDGLPVLSGSATDAVSAYVKEIHKIDESHADIEPSQLPAKISLWNSANRWDGYTKRIISWVSTCHMDGTPTAIFNTGDGMRIRIGYHLDELLQAYCQINFLDYSGTRVMQLHNTHNGSPLEMNGDGYIECIIQDLRLLEGRYIIMVEIGDHTQHLWLDCIGETLSIHVVLGDYLQGVGLIQGQVIFAQKSEWTVYAGENSGPKNLPSGSLNNYE